MLRLGIVGLPNVGKSTLFNALTSSKAAAAENYPFCTVEPNVGVVEVPDPRLERLNELVKPKKKVPAVVEFVDIAGLVKGASQGEGLGNQFLSHIREVDAVVHVIRCFDDPDVVHVMGPVDPVRDHDVITSELALADLAGVERRLEKTRKTARAGEREAQAELGELSGDERTEYLASAGVSEPGLDRLIHAGYRLLGLQTFFTVGENEVRAWTMHRGGTAFDAAGEIHSDFQRGFIRAETVSLEDFVRAGSYKAAREQGLVRSEGRDYVVQDGDILLFRFNV